MGIEQSTSPLPDLPNEAETSDLLYRPEYDEDGNIITPEASTLLYTPEYDKDGNIITPEAVQLSNNGEDTPLFGGKEVTIGDFDYQIFQDHEGEFYFKVEHPQTGEILTLFKGKGLQYINPNIIYVTGITEARRFFQVTNKNGEVGVMDPEEGMFYNTGELDMNTRGEIDKVNIPGPEYNGNGMTYYKQAGGSDTFISIPEGVVLFENSEVYINHETPIMYQGEVCFIASKTTSFNLQGTRPEDLILINAAGKIQGGVNMASLDTFLYGDTHTYKGESYAMDFDGNLTDVSGENPGIRLLSSYYTENTGFSSALFLNGEKSVHNEDGVEVATLSESTFSYQSNRDKKYSKVEFSDSGLKNIHGGDKNYYVHITPDGSVEWKSHTKD